MLGEIQLHRLLVAVDRSASARLALSAAITVTRRDNAALTLIHVVPDAAAEAGRWPAVPTPAPPSQDDFDGEGGKQLMREIVAEMPTDVPVTTIISPRGKPGPEIVRAARERPYDAILVGARGVGRVGDPRGSMGAPLRPAAKYADYREVDPLPATEGPRAVPLPPFPTLAGLSQLAGPSRLTSAAVHLLLSAVEAHALAVDDELEALARELRVAVALDLRAQRHAEPLARSP